MKQQKNKQTYTLLYINIVGEHTGIYFLVLGASSVGITTNGREGPSSESFHVFLPFVIAKGLQSALNVDVKKNSASPFISGVQPGKFISLNLRHRIVQISKSSL